MGTSVVSETLNFFLISLSSSPFLTVPLEMDTLTASPINLMNYLIDITSIDKICD